MKQAGKKKAEADPPDIVIEGMPWKTAMVRPVERLTREAFDDLRRRSTELEAECDQGRYDRDKVLDALTREYHYHMLRADELADFLYDRGITVRPE